MTSRWFMVSNKPLSRHRANQRDTVVRGGRSRGRSRHATPPCSMEKIAFTISRNGHAEAARPGLELAGAAQSQPTRHRSDRFRSAGDRGYAAAEWLGSTSRFQKGFDTLPESRSPQPLNPVPSGLFGMLMKPSKRVARRSITQKRSPAHSPRFVLRDSSELSKPARPCATEPCGDRQPG